MSNDYEMEIIEAVIENGLTVVENTPDFEEKQDSINNEKNCQKCEESSEYSEISELTKDMKEQTTNLVKDQTLPEKEIISQVSTTEMVIDLSLANIARQNALKIIKLESFLGKVEDRLYSDEMIESLSKSDLIQLYTTTRMMKTDAFKMLKEIRKDTDFSSMEATLLSMHAKKDMNTNSNDKMDSILEDLIMNPDFLNQAIASQQEELTKD